MGADSWQHARRRVWGWHVYLEEPEPVEAEALRAAARALIGGGVNLFDIATEWNRNGPPTVHGGGWHTQVVERILRRVSNTQGPEPLLKSGLHERVVKHLDSAGRVISRPRPPGSHVHLPKYLLTSAVFCGVCGAPFRPVGTDRHGRKFGCSRTGVRPQLKSDGERHPTLLGFDIEYEVTARTITAWAAERGVALGVAAGEFDALTRAERHCLVRQYVTATVQPGGWRKRGIVVWGQP